MNINDIFLSLSFLVNFYRLYVYMLRSMVFFIAKRLKLGSELFRQQALHGHRRSRGGFLGGHQGGAQDFTIASVEKGWEKGSNSFGHRGSKSIKDSLAPTPVDSPEPDQSSSPECAGFYAGPLGSRQVLTPSPQDAMWETGC